MMVTAFLAILLMAQTDAPDSVSVRQVPVEDSAPRDDTIEQLSETGGDLRDNEQPVPDADGSSAVPQLSDTETIVEFPRIEGLDRCSAELLSDVDADYCARRLETRSEEFRTAENAPYTAEQVLIGERLIAFTDGDVAARSRAIGAGGLRAEDRDVQALASLTLAPGVAAEEPLAEGTASGLPAETQTLIEAIVERLSDPSGGI